MTSTLSLPSSAHSGALPGTQCHTDLETVMDLPRAWRVQQTSGLQPFDYSVPPGSTPCPGLESLADHPSFPEGLSLPLCSKGFWAESSPRTLSTYSPHSVAHRSRAGLVA